MRAVCASQSYQLCRDAFRGRVRSLLVILASLIYSLTATGQTTINGIVTDVVGSGLPDVHILIKGSYVGTVSDFDGHYSLSTDLSLPFTLVFSFVGYRRQEVEVSQVDSEVNVALIPQVIGTNEIVITAQRRGEELHTVPASVSVLDKEIIERSSLMDRPADAVLYVPGFSGYDATISSNYYTIRGIGSNAFGDGFESSVGVFVDDMYAGKFYTAPALFDIERIEVLKGPQSALFGRNASAGVVSVTSNKPRNRSELDLSMVYGNEGQKGFGYMANFPLTKNLFMRFAGQYKLRNGVRRITNMDNHELGKVNMAVNRLSFLYRFDRRWSALLSHEYQKENSGGQASYNTDTTFLTTGNPYEREIELSIKNGEKREIFATRLNVNGVLNDRSSLESSTTYSSHRGDWDLDPDGSILDIIEFYGPWNYSSFSQEIRILGQNRRLEWLIAGSAYYEELGTDQSLVYNDFVFVDSIPANALGFNHPAFALCDSVSTMVFGPCNPSAREDGFTRSTLWSYGVYGNLTYSLTSKLKISAGLRYSMDQKKFRTGLRPGNGVAGTLVGGNLLRPNTLSDTIEVMDSWDGVQPRLAIDYTPMTNFMIYASYARGYKAGGFNNFNAILVDEETSNAYELGMKSSMRDGRHRFNLAGYYIDYQDLQVQYIRDLTFITENAARVESVGVEIEASVAPLDGLSFVASVALGESRFRDYEIMDTDTTTIAFSGNTPGLSPDRTFSIITQYVRPVKKLGNLVLRADYSYQSLIYFTADNRADLSQNGYGLINASVAIEGFWENRLDVILYTSNLTDTNYINYAEDPGDLGSIVARAVPRLFGVKLNVRILD